MIRSRLTIKTAWPLLLIILVMVAGRYFGRLWAGRPGRHADAHQDAAAGGRGRNRDARTDAGSDGCRTPRRSRSRPPRPRPPQRAATASPAPTQASHHPPRLRRPPQPVAKADGSMASPDYGVQDFLWWQPEVADRDLQLSKDAGFKWVKQLVSWQDVEGAGKGQYDWTNLDRIVGSGRAAWAKADRTCQPGS